jgi:predicted outer membrane repeat protein
MKTPAITFFSLGVAGFLLVEPATQATTFNIANGDVVGLTNAINMANSNGQNDIIELATGGTYTLTSALPHLGPDSGHSLIIHGNGSTIARSGTHNFRLFTIDANSNVTLVALKLSNGNSGFNGGAIYNNFNPDALTGVTTTLAITGCTIDSNTDYYGGAIFNDGGLDAPATAILVITNSTISNNTGLQYGGGIWSENGGSGGSTVLYISNCLFSGNSGSRDAGAIQHDGFTGSATGTIINSTFTNNSAGDNGGAINLDGSGGSGSGANGSAILNVINCTFDHNTANNGGAIALDGSDGTGSTGNAVVKVDSCTFNENSSVNLGDAIYLSQTGPGTTSLQIGNSILASFDLAGDFNISTAPSNGAVISVISKGFNLCDSAGNGLLNQPSDKLNTDPMFDPLGLKDNGGLALTIALQATSPALDQGNRNTIFGLNIDQRGEPRPFDDPNVANATGGDGSDIGAYEGDVRIISSMRVVNDFQITFTSILGRNYEVQGRSTLGPLTTWTTIMNTVPAPPIAGTGGVITVTVPNAFSFNIAYYRLHQL